jgi:pullulanase/glycogen debranching enzyme
MTPHDWSDHEARTITLVLDGTVSTGLTPAGTDEFDDTFCLVLNARLEPVEVVVPPLHGRTTWQVVVDTSEDEVPGDRARSVEAGSPITVPDLAMLVLTMPRAAQ